MPHSDREGRISRRRWMELLGMTGAASVAGCLGGDDDGTATPGDGNGDSSTDTDTPTGGNGDDDGEDTDTATPEEDIGIPENTDANRVNYMRGGVLFTNLNWNNFSDNFNSTVVNYFTTQGALTRADNLEIEGIGFSEFDYDPDSRIISVTLRDDLQYHNGDDYTAEDLWTWQEMLRLQAPENSNFESIEQTGDYSLEFTTMDQWKPAIAQRQLVSGMTFDFGARIWTEWLERYQDASDQDERDSITEDLSNNFEITTQEVIDQGLGTGAWEIEQVTEEYMDFVANLDHFTHAGRDDRFDPNVRRVRMWYADEQGRRDQFIVNERIDAIGHGHDWVNYQDSLPDYWEQVLYAPTGRSFYKMLINWRNREYLQDVNFRRAMAAALDYENAATNTGYFPVRSHSGMGENFNLRYWDENVPSDFIDYGSTSDTELMNEYLDRSDYEIDGNSVVGPDGEEHDPMRFVIGGSAWGENAQIAYAQLDQAGFPVEQRAVDRSTKLDIIQDDPTMSDWDLSTETHYAGITYHATEFFKPDTFWGLRIGPGGFGAAEDFTSSVEGWLEEGETHSAYNGKPLVAEVPEEIGAEDLSGDTKEVNIYEAYNEAVQPVGEERTRELIKDLSWTWNFLLPDIDLTVPNFDTFGNTQKLEFASESELMAFGSNPPGYAKGTIRLRDPPYL